MIQTTFKYSLEGQESDRLLFRKVEETDFETWVEFCAYPDSLKYIFSPENLLIEDPREKCRVWFKRVFNRYEKGLGGMNVLINKQTGELVGQCGLLIQSVDGIEEMEVGYSLMPKHRGNGYAREAAKKCMDFAFENKFRESLISLIDPDNIDSAKVALANGMTLYKRIFFDHGDVNVFRINKS